MGPRKHEGAGKNAIEMKLRDGDNVLGLFKEPGGIDGWGPFGSLTAGVQLPEPVLRRSNRVRNANNIVARRPNRGPPTGRMIT